MRWLFVLLIASGCATPAAVADTVPDEHDADARSAERDELEKLLAMSAGQPDESKLLLRLAELEAQQGRLDERQALERKTLAAEAAQRNNPSVHDAQQADAERFEHAAAQVREAAVKRLQSYVDRFSTDPSAPRALFVLAETEHALQHDDLADAALARLLRDFSASPVAFDAHLMLAERRFEKGDMPGAIAEYDAAAKGERQRDYATYKRGWCRINSKQFDLALKDFTAVMAAKEGKLATEAAKDWVRAWAMIDGSNGASAEAALEKTPHPGTTQALLKRLAETYKQMGRDADASETERLAQ